MWSAAAARAVVSPLPAPSLLGGRRAWAAARGGGGSRAATVSVRSTLWDFVGGDLVRPDLGQWLDDVEKHKALAIYPPHEGGYEGRYLNRLRYQGYYFLDLSARGLGDPETTLTKIHPVCPPSLGRQPVARWYFPPEVDYRLSLLHPDAKGLVVWIIEAKVLSKAELQFLAMLPDLRPKVRVIAECGNWYVLYLYPHLNCHGNICDQGKREGICDQVDHGPVGCRRKFVWKPLKQIAGLEPDPDAEQ
ncbi:NAD(P)H-quinone oxidoreductase subunit N, chloroplastic [Dichanthelium oligosanthes]|uniref:NAD(P)H-quinone oxidoreductase subunit N, chloroplastic n=1 Tax=Dichanthelium oligosanthes TaxID=888268 RepID=A0A1E5W0J3_9POAL|nr:NAD(P)H-quinone oxidoreductase subunit N, chloroplastic [Dichanthelium oligosanthes]